MDAAFCFYLSVIGAAACLALSWCDRLLHGR